MITNRDPITWHDMRPTHTPLAYTQELRRRALGLWRRADAALDAGDRELWHETMRAAALVEEYALLRELLDDPRTETERDLDWLDAGWRQTYESVRPY